MSNYETLRKVNVNEHIEKKNNLSYLSWAWAVDVLLQHDPKATWEYGEPKTFGETMMVFCTVNAFDKSMTAQLPVMDHRNKAIPKPDAFSVNTAMQRCLAKAIALHGLGLYIYAGEDLPDGEESEKKTDLSGRMADNKDVQDDLKANGYDANAVYDTVIFELNACQDTDMLADWVKVNKETRRMNGLPSDLKNDVTTQYNKLKQHFADKGV